MAVALTDARRRAALLSAAAQPSPGADPGFGDSFMSAWREMQRFHNSSAEVQNRIAVVDEEIERLRAATGETAVNPERLRTVIRMPGEVDRAYDRLREQFDGAGLTFPEDDALQARALERSGASRESAALLRERQSSWGSFWGDLLGGMGAGVLDPVNATSLAFGASYGAGILRMAAIEAGIGAGSQAAIEAGTFGYKRQVDPAWSGTDAVANVAFTGAAGGVFGGGVAGAASLWRGLLARAGPEPLPRDVADAGLAVDREAGIAATNPYADAGFRGEAAHRANVERAEEALAQGRPLELPVDEFTAGAAARAAPAMDVEAPIVRRDTPHAVRDDLIPHARTSLEPETVEKALIDPIVDDAVVQDAMRLIADTPEASVELSIRDASGNEAVQRVVLRQLFDETDAEIAAAREIEACATGIMEAAE